MAGDSSGLPEGRLARSGSFGRVYAPCSRSDDILPAREPDTHRSRTSGHGRAPVWSQRESRLVWLISEEGASRRGVSSGGISLTAGKHVRYRRTSLVRIVSASKFRMRSDKEVGQGKRPQATGPAVLGEAPLPAANAAPKRSCRHVRGKECSVLIQCRNVMERKRGLRADQRVDSCQIPCLRCPERILGPRPSSLVIREGVQRDVRVHKDHLGPVAPGSVAMISSVVRPAVATPRTLRIRSLIRSLKLNAGRIRTPVIQFLEHDLRCSAGGRVSA